MAAKHETDEKRIPGTAPGAEVKGDLAEQRYGAASENAMPPDTAAPGSIRAVIAEEIAKALAAAGLAKTPEEQAAPATRRALAEPTDRMRRTVERQGNAVEYRALGDVWVDDPGGSGGLYVRQGQVFRSDKPPGRLWEPLDAEGKARKEDVARRERERAEIAAEQTVAMSALDHAKGTLERAMGAGGRYVPDSERDAGLSAEGGRGKHAGA